MATTTSHNKKSSAVKRILSEAREISSDKSDLYSAAPLEDNIFEWHFTLRGPISTEFANGLYHGRILLPAEYPMRPPNLLLLTPNGRWELNKKICLTFTGYHEEMWQPAWGIRTALLGLQTFMTAKAEAAVGIGALDYPADVREKLALESRKWRCPTCAQTNLELLPDPDPCQESRHESLPEGLSVDLSAKPRTQSAGETPTTGPATTVERGSNAPTDHASPAAALASASPVSAPPPTAPTPVLASASAPTSASVPASASVPVPASASASASANRPPYTQSNRIPTTPSQPAQPLDRPPPSQGLDSQQKLLLIDRCIAWLTGLVALLILKRLI
ncbi:UBC-like protein [Testicularia cyperi]|uniref:UBC-like protein n=1 Tax=Testicularia cyperi TaxID=1882483 RepID=A0A317XFQ5_9BASI|nr:UBC-like protein [Testicularia cyperi]